ncbi:hypothetical protein T439DRAFT_165125 [Meredithblackwellia eburnea MCA 4105]
MTSQDQPYVSPSHSRPCAWEGRLVLSICSYFSLAWADIKIHELATNRNLACAVVWASVGTCFRKTTRRM